MIGVVLLIVALFTAWYSIATSVHGGDVPANAQDAYFYAGFPSTSGTVREVCTGAFASECSSQSSYMDYGSGYHQAGLIAEYVNILLLVGISFALCAAMLGLYAHGNRRRVSVAVVVAIIALVIAVAAPGLYAAALPSAIGNGMNYHSGSGPWSTFFGSNTSTSSKPSNITGTYTWGPSTGWFLSIGASVVLLAGLVLLIRLRRGTAQAASTSSSSSPVAAPSPPPSLPTGP